MSYKTINSLKFFILILVLMHVHAHSFSVRVILIWNRLPAALVQENNLSVFKSMLRTFDFSYTLLGNL